MSAVFDNPVRRKLRDGEASFGLMAFELFTPGLAAILAAAGADYVFLDMEHSGIGIEVIKQQVAAARGTGLVPLVRVPGLSYEQVATALDAGALGIMAPRIETAEEARDLVAFCRYRPLGRRGLAFGIAHDSYRVGDVRALMDAANEAILTVALVETETGIANIEEIAAVPGIDVCWLGHYDLTDSMGMAGRFDQEAFWDAARRLADATRRNNVAAGFLDADPALLERMIGLGFRALGVGTDVGLLRESLRAGLNSARTLYGKAAPER